VVDDIERVEISPEEIDEVINYIRKNMQEEVASWREDKVRMKVKDWYIKKLNTYIRKKIEVKTVSQREDKDIHIKDREEVKEISIEKPSDLLDSKSEDKIEDIEEQIMRCPPEKLREILITLIKEYPEIRKIIGKHYMKNPSFY